jgi:hypothetical protein
MKISALIGAMTILEKPIVVLPLLRKCAEILNELKVDERLNNLDALHSMAFYDGTGPSSIDQGEWQNDWWNELAKASFPHDNVN